MNPRTVLAQWIEADRRGIHGRLFQGTTKDRYEDDVAHWLTFLEGLGLDAWTATEAHVATWLDARDLAPRSRARSVSALSAFYAYAERLGLVHGSPAAHHLRGQPHKEPSGAVLTSVQTQQLKDCADALTGNQAPRDRLLIYLLLCRLRPRQIIELNVQDLHFEQHRVSADIWQKGGGTRLTALPRAVGEALLDYRPHRIWSTPDSHNTFGPVLTTYRGHRLDPHVTPAAIVREAARLAPDWLPPDLRPDTVAHSPTPFTTT